MAVDLFSRRKMSRFRLAIVISHPIQYHAPLYGYLARDLRFEVKVFYMSDRGARPFYEKFSRTIVRYDNPILEGYPCVFLNSGEPKNRWQEWTEFISFRLRGEILRFSPHGVYFHGYNNPSFLWAMRGCRKVGIRVFLRGENEDVLPRPFWKIWLREPFLGLLFPCVDAFLYIGARNKDFFIRRHIPEQKLFFVPYAVDNLYFKAGRSQEELDRIRNAVLQQYALKKESRLFIYTHKLRPTMRPLDAVRAFCGATFHLKNPGAVLIVCGDGQMRPAVEALVKAKGQGKVILAGHLNQAALRDHLLASDVMINPAIEPWGCSVNEGLASGLAILCSDLVVGWPDMVIPGANGYVYRCGDLPDLSRLIQRLISLPPDELLRMKTHSLGLSEKLSFSTCADGLEKAFHFASHEQT